MMPMTIKFRQWQRELLQEIKIIENDNARDRKIFWIEDSNGSAGKSTFSKFLSFGQKDWKVKKLPIDSPNRIRMAVCKLMQLKNGHVVSVLYGNPMEVATTSPHVAIFTNEKFKDYEKYLSRDRWISYVITSDKVLIARKWDADVHQWMFLPVSSKIKTICGY